MINVMVGLFAAGVMQRGRPGGRRPAARVRPQPKKKKENKERRRRKKRESFSGLSACGWAVVVRGVAGVGDGHPWLACDHPCPLAEAQTASGKHKKKKKKNKKNKKKRLFEEMPQ